MINKIYAEIVKTIKENYKLFLSFIFLFILMILRLPYYIEAPGGIIDIDKRIVMEEKSKSVGTFNLTYVKEIRATVPTLIYAYINKNWDIVKIKDIKYKNEKIKDVDYRNKILLEEANSNAIRVAYRYANKELSITREHLYITYIDDEAKTNLKIGDELLKIDGVDIISKDQLYNIIKERNVDANLTFTVKRDNEVTECFAKIRIVNNDKKIGIVISKISDLNTNPKVILKFRSSESGPSGGLITALSIYNSLTEDDITGGKTIVGTGAIDENGKVESIGGIEYKIKGAVKAKADIFLVPAGENYDEAKKVVNNNNYNLLLIQISSFDEALEKLNALKK